MERVLGYSPVAQALSGRGLSAGDVHRRYLASALWFNAQPLLRPVCRDADDDHVLACAVAAHADLIVSGDGDLLDLGDYERIPIMTASAALERIASVV